MLVDPQVFAGRLVPVVPRDAAAGVGIGEHGLQRGGVLACQIAGVPGRHDADVRAPADIGHLLVDHGVAHGVGIGAAGNPTVPESTPMELSIEATAPVCSR